MILATLAFYTFALVMLISGLLVITAKNPVHSVLFLILAFFNSAGLFVLLHAEFIAMLMVIVYVGAVAVLFLFVVMMLDVDIAKLRSGFVKNLPLSIAVAIITLAELCMIFMLSATDMGASEPLSVVSKTSFNHPTNTHAIGNILYTDYAYPFQIAGLILLVAMIGAITLTLRTRQGVKKQNITKQVNRKRSQGVTLVDVKSGRGI